MSGSTACPRRKRGRSLGRGGPGRRSPSDQGGCPDLCPTRTQSPASTWSRGCPGRPQRGSRSPTTCCAGGCSGPGTWSGLTPIRPRRLCSATRSGWTPGNGSGTPSESGRGGRAASPGHGEYSGGGARRQADRKRQDRRRRHRPRPLPRCRSWVWGTVRRAARRTPRRGSPPAATTTRAMRTGGAACQILEPSAATRDGSLLPPLLTSLKPRPRNRPRRRLRRYLDPGASCTGSNGRSYGSW